jgi:prepilin peptidase CpaA
MDGIRYRNGFGIEGGSFMFHVPELPLLVVMMATFIAAFTDIRSFKVYNILTMPLLLTGLIFHAATEGLAGVSGSLLGALFGFAALVVVYVMGGMGAGDVKLMAGVGAWLGLPLTFYVLIASSLAAGVFAVFLLLLSRNPRETWLNLQILALRLSSLGRHLGSEDRLEAEMNRADHRRRLIPFAAMIALGVVATCLWFYVSPL